MKSVTLTIHGHQPPSFKNHKRSGINPSTGKLMSYTRKDIKQRMKDLEDAIVSALYSSCQTDGGGTHSGCSKPSLTALSELLRGLTDDSVNQIPKGEWDVRYVPKGQEGVEINIEEIQ